jgi:peptidyl-prolyl cis-trans isomerase SurA
MKAFFGLLATGVVGMLLLQGCSPKASESVVLEVGSKKVTLGEYENFFVKNSGGDAAVKQSSIDERNRFLDLLTNYKLKLQDASDRNLMNDSDIVAEMKEYRQTLASTYLVDKEITEPGIQRMYDRRKEELRARHILFIVKPDASPEDTLKAYQKAMDIIKRLHAGESFDSLALKFSEDPSVKSNHGDVYYFSSGQMVTSFENAAYAMKKGEISSVPVRSPFGYHILSLDERHPSPGAIRVRHIMTLYRPQGAAAPDTAGALARLKALQDSVKAGAPFDMIAFRHSEDQGTSNRGGDLGWVERKRFVQVFDEAAFKLSVGQVSGIIQSPFGFHIIRCDSIRPMGSYASLRDEMKKQYQQTRFNEDYQAYIAALKKEFGYTFNDNAFAGLLAVLDTTETSDDSAWDANITPAINASALMTLDGKPVTVDTVLSVLRARPELRNTSLRGPALKTQIGRIAEGMLLDRKSFGLEARNPDFKALMEDYYDGILLYKAEQQEVWNKTVVTDTALQRYFAENHAKFVMPAKVDMGEIYVESDTLALMVYDSLTHGGDFKAFAERYNLDPELKEKGGRRGMQSVKDDEVAAKAFSLKVGQISEPFAIEGGFAIVKLFGSEPAREKTFDEAGAEVSNAYQEAEAKRLEQQWLSRIRERHPVKQYRELLPQAFSSSSGSTR